MYTNTHAHTRTHKPEHCAASAVNAQIHTRMTNKARFGVG